MAESSSKGVRWGTSTHARFIGCKCHIEVHCKRTQPHTTRSCLHAWPVSRLPGSTTAHPCPPGKTTRSCSKPLVCSSDW